MNLRITIFGSRLAFAPSRSGVPSCYKFRSFLTKPTAMRHLADLSMAASATSGHHASTKTTSSDGRGGRLSLDGFHQWASTRWSPTTADSYRRNSVWFLAFLKRVPPQTLIEWPVTLLEDFVRWISEHREYHPSTLRGILVATQRYLDYMRFLGLPIPELPNPELHSTPIPETPDLSPVQLEAFLDCLPSCSPNPTRRAALSIMPFCGLRASEIAELRLENVKVVAPWVTLHVNDKSARPRTSYLLRPGQEPFLRYLRRCLDRGAISKGSWLFPNSHGGQLYSRQLRKDILAIRKELDIPWLTSRVLTTTYEGILKRHEVRPSVIAYLTGDRSAGPIASRVTHEDVNAALNPIHPA